MATTNHFVSSLNAIIALVVSIGGLVFKWKLRNWGAISSLLSTYTKMWITGAAAGVCLFVTAVSSSYGEEYFDIANLAAADAKFVSSAVLLFIISFGAMIVARPLVRQAETRGCENGDHAGALVMSGSALGVFYTSMVFSTVSWVKVKFLIFFLHFCCFEE